MWVNNKQPNDKLNRNGLYHNNNNNNKKYHMVVLNVANIATFPNRWKYNIFVQKRIKLCIAAVAN